ncbi:unnamed protein product [Schistocephalus solidus]|uniref:OBERON-like protein n=1 Tax=Schistocephalus solidus TaxID=70667 RepID=A0A183SKI4_SCHSO|nr:unnamed protein product [Schistocephalus solidus]
MEIAELSLQSIAAAIDDHIQERCKLAEELKDVEAKSAAAEKALREAEKIVADARSEAVSLVEKKQLLLNKISTTNAMNDRLQKSFLKNQDKEKELESQLAKTESDISNERDKLNGEFLKLQNPTFFDLRIRDTTDFELPEM